MSSRYPIQLFIVQRRFVHDSKGSKFIKIGNVKVPVRRAERAEYVPKGYVTEGKTEWGLQGLKWLLRKDVLNQDVFLIGVPGSLRSDLVLSYLELSNREFEYLSLTRDTTEADIKQRREIQNGTAQYTDLCSVRAALNGRVLVIDGVEKAERNVLPILNNLLENREMQLDDGRFLMDPVKFDKLLQKYNPEEMTKMKLERVSEDFHVIALGLPVPVFKGHSLDPPLRSRFQCLNLSGLPFEVVQQMCSSVSPNIDPIKRNNVIGVCFGINVQQQGTSLGLPRVPIDNMVKAFEVWNLNPTLSEEEVIASFYPKSSILKRETELSIYNQFLDDFSVKRNKKLPPATSEMASEDSTVKINRNNDNVTFTVPTGTVTENIKHSPFVSTPYHEDVMSHLMTLHSKVDFCLLGGKGTGKTAIIEEFGRRLNYHLETITLFQDMNSRELVQQRKMLPNGDTVWEDSQLIKAAKEGSLCVLDGLEKVHWSTAEVLAPLVFHRFIHLPDGGRLISPEAFELLKKENGWSDKELNLKGVYEISPRFRLVALADSQSADGSGPTSKWLNDQILSLFLFKSLEVMTLEEEKHLILSLVPNSKGETSEKLIQFSNYLKSSSDVNLRHIGALLSMRRIISIMKRSAQKPEEGLYNVINRSALSKFLPRLTKSSFLKAMDKFGISPENASSATNSGWKEELKAGQNPSHHDSMIPDVVFFDNTQHMKIMEDMAVDFSLGEHILLIGNQGVGKNKITDRFLQHIQRPRQYMQLHRDTTVQSLTVQSTVAEGKLLFEDSPLVKAVKDGLVLVVDEADKAPLHVIAVLKSLLDSGYLYLADGRRIQPPGAEHLPDNKSITIHSDFRIIMLANRPGFPFLGNDLFNVLGDLFAVHVVDNPDPHSEAEMLKQYGPEVKQETIDLLVSVFGKLRRMSDEGQLNYPYSTRELVNIVRHVNQFPDDPLIEVVRNVFDFDAYSKDTVGTIETVFRAHGIPLGLIDRELPVHLAKRYPLPEATPLGSWGVRNNVVPHKVQMSDTRITTSQSQAWGDAHNDLLIQYTRAYGFSEQSQMWQLEMEDGAMVSDVLNQGQRTVVAGVNSPTLFVMQHPKQSHAIKIPISSYLPRLFGNYRPRLTMARFGSNEILVHEEMSNTLLKVNFIDNVIEQVELEDENRFVKLFTNKIAMDGNHWKLISVSDTVALLYDRMGNTLIKLDSKTNSKITLTLPEDTAINNIIPVNENRLLVLGNDKQKLLTMDKEQSFLRELDVDNAIPLEIDNGTSLGMSQAVSSEDGAEFNCPNFLMANEDYYYLKSSMFPEMFEPGQVVAVKRTDDEDTVQQPPYYYSPETKDLNHPFKNTVTFNNGIIVRSLPNWKTPASSWPDGAQTGQICGFLEVIDTKNNSRYHIPVPAPVQMTYYNTWAQSLSPVPFVMCKGSDENSLYTCDLSGGTRKWEIDQTALFESYNNWRRSLGLDRADERVEITRDDDDFDLGKLDEPKFGKVDPKNTPHAGGNTWAGGTGGYNTAGLGGIGGPFRLDAGHDVKQMSDKAKSQVPEEIKKKARAIAKKEYQKRLKDIEMSVHDAKQYDALHAKIEKEVNSLRNVIESLEAREKERQWAKNQTVGDLDDAKLIEGIAGEKNIYRKRVEQVPEPGTVITKPKRVQLLVDVSGSMYRFNGHDQRLKKSLETSLLVMEALEGKKDKIKYDIVGHSGDSPEVVFTTASNPPDNEKAKMDVLKKMLAHSQFCFSGDYTLEAIEMAAHKLAKESEVDERFVIALSDANLNRYGIKPEHLARVLELEDNVHCFLILIGSLGPQAAEIKRKMPPGKAFVIKNTSELPQIMKDIFSSTLL